jgi:ribosome-binding protein aMBF1 (putative translation factor)
VIENEQQYRITESAVRDFEIALARLDTVEAGRSPEIRRVMREAIESQLDELRDQLAEYDALRNGKRAILELDSLGDLPDALIRARIVAGLSQKELAQRLGIREQQVQRYEASRYAGASLERIRAVAEALGIRIRERVILPAPGGPAS